MINAITLNNLRNSEFVQFITDVLAIVQRNNPADLKVQEQYNNLMAICTSLETLFKNERGSAITDTINVLDERRDNAINGISSFVQALTYHYDEATRKHANALARHLKLYGTGIARENFQSETAIINNILTDWESKQPYTDALASLNLVAWKDELRTANSAFSAQYLERTQELSAAPPETLKEKRIDACDAYYALRDFIVSFYTIHKGAEPFNKTVKQLNALIDQYNALITGRKSTNSTKPENED